MRITFYFIPLLFFVYSSTGLGACGDPPPSKYPTNQAHEIDSTLAVGDIFEVKVYKQDDLSGEYKVSSEGTISFPHIGIVKVTSKVPAQVEREIQVRLADGYYKNPSVSVRLTTSKSKSVSVLGEVSKPEAIIFTNRMTIIDVIAKAGGFTPMAQKNAVTITRIQNGQKNRYTIPVGSIEDGKADMFYVRPGDVVSIPRRRW